MLSVAVSSRHSKFFIAKWKNILVMRVFFFRSNYEGFISIHSMLAEKTKNISKKGLEMIRLDVANAHDNFADALTKHALYKTSDIELSQDLVQVTFLKTLMYLQKGGKIDTMRSFLNRILNDLVIDEYRKRKTTSLDRLLGKGFELSVDDSEKIMNIFDGKEAVTLLRFLPKKYQVVMRMRYIQGLSIKEMSVLTGQTENTVAVQSHRGLAKLRILYEESHK